jgi:putative DNA primase/helicase
MDLKQEAAKLQLKYLERVIAQAYAEGASPQAIDAWLTGQGVKDPEVWRGRVEAMKVARLMGSQEIKNLGGRQAFRDLFQLPPIPAPVYAPRTDEFPLTETGDAEFFAKLYSDDLRYDHRQGRWLVADEASGLWLPDPIEKVIQLAVNSIRQRQAHAMQISDDQRERKAALDWAVKGESRGRLSSTLALGESTPPLADAGDGWDVNPMLLGTLNGVVDLTTGEHRKAKPTEHVTMHVRAAFDPTATCPTWLAALETIFHQPGNPEETARMVSFVQRALGYSITGDCREECCFFTWGIGGNGKGTMMNTLGWLMQDYYDDMPYSTLERSVHGNGIPNDVAKLDGKRFVTCAEVQEFTINESRLKALTGRDPMTARFLNKEFFTFIPVCKIWIATNNKPRITGQDDGIWRRPWPLGLSTRRGPRARRVSGAGHLVQGVTKG